MLRNQRVPAVRFVKSRPLSWRLKQAGKDGPPVLPAALRRAATTESRNAFKAGRGGPARDFPVYLHAGRGYPERVKLSVKSDYATRAVLSLARHYPAGAAQRVENVASAQSIPANYLVQILIELKAQGIARSVRGKEGGYLLARAPSEITLGDVLRAVHGEVFDTPALSDANCPPELRRAWQRLKSAVDQAADKINFQQLLDESSEKEKMYYI